MPDDLRRILTLEVPIIVQLGQRLLSLRDVISLIPGAIIELPKAASEELELLVNNKVVGTGTAVKVGENFGLKIMHIGDARERINALSDADQPASSPADRQAETGSEPHIPSAKAA